jgi:hypothetical protein
VLKPRRRLGDIEIKFHAFEIYVGLLISLWLFLFPVSLFAAQPKEFLLGEVKEVRTIKS